MAKDMNEPTIEHIKSLDGRIFATLSSDEEEVLNYYRARGRKYGVSVDIVNEDKPEELSRAKSQLQADDILKRSNSRIVVTLSNN